jgi:uncharacterized membrane protein
MTILHRSISVLVGPVHCWLIVIYCMYTVNGVVWEFVIIQSSRTQQEPWAEWRATASESESDAYNEEVKSLL